MAEVHIERLRRLERCPICQGKRVAFINVSGHFKAAFSCDAIFVATQDDDRVTAQKSCGYTTAIAVRLLTEECRGAAS